ncbi:MAG: hypothetical protein IT165_12925 [Bryobacterales bacterium]|nr:hypothetical protein [Bryobacterales bacterium]
MQANVETPHLTEWSVPDAGMMRELCGYAGACVSLYVQSHAPGAGSAAAGNWMKSVMPEIAQRLRERGMEAAEVTALLTPLEELASREKMQTGSSGGLAVFRSPRDLIVIRLPWDMPAAWTVAGRFHVRPLYEALRVHRRFFVLALARKRVRLLECQGDTCQAVPLPENVPRSLPEFGEFDQPDHDLFNRSAAGPGKGDMEAVRFGTGAGQDKDYHRIHDFHKRIAQTLDSMLAKAMAPLVLGATETDAASYRKVSAYARIVEGAVGGSPDDGMTDGQLSALARPLVSEWIDPDEARVLDQYRRAGRHLKSVETNEILAAAAAGRVLHLFVARGGSPQLGDVDRISGHTRLAGEFASAGDDLTNAAMAETVRHSGNLWPLAAEQMPDGAGMAALLRY